VNSNRCDALKPNFTFPSAFQSRTMSDQAGEVSGVKRKRFKLKKSRKSSTEGKEKTSETSRGKPGAKTAGTQSTTSQVSDCLGTSSNCGEVRICSSQLPSCFSVASLINWVWSECRDEHRIIRSQAAFMNMSSAVHRLDVDGHALQCVLKI